MYIMTEDGERAVNTDYITDLELTGGAVPEEAESEAHPWKVVANLRYPDKSRSIVLFKDPRRRVVMDMLKTYMHLIDRKVTS